MTARETAVTLAEMTGGFDLRRDAIAAALDVAYRRGVGDAARVVLNYGCGAHDCPVGANILALLSEYGLPSPPTEQKD